MPAYDSVAICNLALSNIGEGQIHNFEDTENKYSRLCQSHFNFYSEWLMSSYDWSFARSHKKLQKLDVEYSSLYGYSYAVPSDSLKIRDVLPRSRQEKWRIMDGNIMTQLDNVQCDLYVIYTRANISPEEFNHLFVSALVSVLTGSLCAPITGDESWSQQERLNAENVIAMNFDADSRIGDTYISQDQNPNLDTFVDPTSVVNIPVLDTRYQ